MSVYFIIIVRGLQNKRLSGQKATEGQKECGRRRLIAYRKFAHVFICPLSILFIVTETMFTNCLLYTSRCV